MVKANLMTDEAKALVERLRQVTSVLFDDYGDGTHAVEDYALAGKAADLIETQAREIERLRGHWQFLSDLLTQNIVENDQPHRVKLKDGWHDGPVADHHVRIMLAIRKLSRTALGDSHDQ